MTVNKIITAMAQAIEKEFGSKYDIYTEDMEQEFKEPCFFISVISPMHSGLLKDKYKETNKFDVMFFPKSDGNENEKINEVYEKLCDILEIIIIEKKKYRGTDMSAEIADGVLHFFVNYNFHLEKKRDKKYMERLYQKEGIKNGREYGKR